MVTVTNTNTRTHLQTDDPALHTTQHHHQPPLLSALRCGTTSSWARTCLTQPPARCPLTCSSACAGSSSTGTPSTCVCLARWVGHTQSARGMWVDQEWFQHPRSILALRVHSSPSTWVCMCSHTSAVHHTNHFTHSSPGLAYTGGSELSFGLFWVCPASLYDYYTNRLAYTPTPTYPPSYVT